MLIREENAIMSANIFLESSYIFQQNIHIYIEYDSLVNPALFLGSTNMEDDKRRLCHYYIPLRISVIGKLK
jgi:hypothetical protein